MYVAHAVPPGHPAPAVRSVATVVVDPVNMGMVTWMGAPPVGGTVCRALRTISAPVAPPSAVVTCPVMTTGAVLTPRTSGIVPRAVPAGPSQVMVGLYVTPVAVSAAITI